MTERRTVKIRDVVNNTELVVTMRLYAVTALFYRSTPICVKISYQLKKFPVESAIGYFDVAVLCAPHIGLGLLLSAVS